jgi:hypothetical protein
MMLPFAKRNFATKVIASLFYEWIDTPLQIMSDNFWATQILILSENGLVGL